MLTAWLHRGSLQEIRSVHFIRLDPKVYWGVGEVGIIGE